MKYILIFCFIIFAILIAAAIVPSVVKQILFTLSIGTKLICGFLGTTLLVDMLSIDNSLVHMIVGTLLLTGLIFLFGSLFRLVAYSINTLSCSILIGILSFFLGDKAPTSFLFYAVALFILSRVVWIIERFGEYDEYDHTAGNTIYYITHDHDYWGNSEGAWNFLPMQIPVSFIFYSISSYLITTMVSIQSSWITPAVALTAVINLVFDMFIFRWVDSDCDDYVSET